MSRLLVCGTVLTSLMLSSLISIGCAEKKPAEVKAAPAPPPAPPATLTQIKSELLAAKAQMDVTTASLNDLSKSSGADAQTNFDKFSTEYAKLQSAADTCRSRAEGLKQRTKEYFDTWNKQQGDISNPDLRRRATQQRMEAEKTYSTIKSEMELTKLSFEPYMNQLKDVSAYLKGNSSPAAIASVSDLVAKATADSKEVSKHLDSVLAEINKIMAASGEMPAGAAAAPSPPPKQD